MVDETAIDHALLEALSKADPGPYPKRIPYTAAVRQFLPDPVTALRWATYTAAGTVLLSGAALVVRAMGLDYQTPPPPTQEAIHDLLPKATATVEEPVVVRIVETVSEIEEKPEPGTLVAEDAGKVSVVPVDYAPKHAAPDLDLTLLGMRLAVDLS